MKKIILVLVCLLTNHLMHSQQSISPITPFENDTIETNYPLFSWFVSDFGQGRSIYRFIVSEIHENQSAEEAINSNISQLKIENQIGTQLLYPIDAPELKYNQWYAWQVQRIEGNHLADKSEAWKFILYKPEPKKIKFLHLQHKMDATIHIINDQKLYVKFDEKYQTENLQISILNSSKEVVQTNNAKKVFNSEKFDGALNAKKIGTNFYEISVGMLNKEEVYELITYNEKGKKYQLKFKCI